MRKMTALGLTLLALVMILLWPGAAHAFSRVAVRDEANILSPADINSIQQAAQNLPFETTVWTTNTHFANHSAFVQAVDGLAGSQRVVIAVQPIQRWSHIATRQNTNLSAAQLQQARAAANAQFGHHNWGAGFTAALNTLARSVGASAPTSQPVNNMAPAMNGTMQPSQPVSGGIGGFWIWILIIAVVFFFLTIARRIFGGGGGMINRSPYGPGMNPGGYGYGPGMNQGGGINPLVSGGLGALGGGLVGYELGKEAGETDAQNQNNQGNNNFGGQQDYGTGDAGGIVQSDTGDSNAPDFGSDSSSDFGGDSGGDFGGGDSGGSTDF